MNIPRVTGNNLRETCVLNALEQLHWLLGEGNQSIAVELANHGKEGGEEKESVNMKVMGRLPALTLSTESKVLSSPGSPSSQSP